MFDFSVGAVVEFRYPAANVRGVPPRWEQRRVRVDRLRFLAEEPLRGETLSANPLQIAETRLTRSPRTRSTKRPAT